MKVVNEIVYGFRRITCDNYIINKNKDVYGFFWSYLSKQGNVSFYKLKYLFLRKE